MLTGELQQKSFWLVELDTGHEHRLTDFGPEFVIGDFGIAADGREIAFDRVEQESDVVLFELPPR